jgi:hypothetical protein
MHRWHRDSPLRAPCFDITELQQPHLARLDADASAVPSGYQTEPAQLRKTASTGTGFLRKQKPALIGICST